MNDVLTVIACLGFILFLLIAFKIFEKAAEWIESWFEEK